MKNIVNNFQKNCRLFKAAFLLFIIYFFSNFFYKIILIKYHKNTNSITKYLDIFPAKIQVLLLLNSIFFLQFFYSIADNALLLDVLVLYGKNCLYCHLSPLSITDNTRFCLTHRLLHNE